MTSPPRPHTLTGAPAGKPVHDVWRAVRVGVRGVMFIAGYLRQADPAQGHSLPGTLIDSLVSMTHAIGLPSLPGITA